MLLCCLYMQGSAVGHCRHHAGLRRNKIMGLVTSPAHQTSLVRPSQASRLASPRQALASISHPSIICVLPS